MSTKISKKELADALVADGVLATKSGAVEVIDALFAKIGQNLASGNEVEVFGFGKFKVTERAAREGINPKTKEKIQIAAKKAVGFKAAAALSKTVA